jgi:FlgD Ig-like domain
MLRRIDDYLQRNEVEGVTMDWRYSVIPSEEIRQTVVCQLLAYVELSRLDPRARLRIEVTRHADFLLARLDSIRSNTPFDGMLAYSLLGAYEITRDARFLDAGRSITSDLLAIPTSECILNGGLMVAMATAELGLLTGDTGAQQKTHDIVAQLVPYQNPDGSFPHWCIGSRDIHYTAWMAMELIHLERMLHDDHIAPLLSSMSSFLEGRIDPLGHSIYQQPCPNDPNCTEYFYSRATGCSFDLDSRGWTVEPAYCGLLFDHEGSPKQTLVMGFLDSLETGGTIADLFGYWPPPSDPEYPWTTADTSVVCMSIIEWALSTEVADRIARGIPVDLILDDLIDTQPPPPPPVVFENRSLSAEPNPAPGGCMLRFSLSAPHGGSLVVFDASGREVRKLESGPFAPGVHASPWDGRDDEGRGMANGIYFARLRLDTSEESRRIVLRR